MALRPKDIEHLLEYKFGFAPVVGRSGHRYYEYQIPGLGTIQTHVSHSNKTDVGVKLLNLIARQLKVRLSFCKGMFDCNNSREAYLAKVEADPYPPFRT